MLDEDDIFAYLVPKNAAVARKLADKLGSTIELVPYVHTEKTQMLRSLIPNGAEDSFTLQQWWDAHVFVYEQLDLAVDNYLPRLKAMFEDLKQARKEPLTYTTGLSEDLFLPGKWPQVSPP